MGGIGDAIKYLYDNFLLRDVLSFVTPGAVVTAAAVFVVAPEVFDRHLPWPLFIPLFGVFFVVGYALQSLGVLFGLLRINRHVDRNARGWAGLCLRFRFFRPGWDNERNVWWKRAYFEVQAFNAATERPELAWARQQVERVVVLRQMCGNGSLATLVAGILLCVGGFVNDWYTPFLPCWLVALSLVLVTLFLPLLLYWGYRASLISEDSLRHVILQHLTSGES